MRLGKGGGCILGIREVNYYGDSYHIGDLIRVRKDLRPGYYYDDIVYLRGMVEPGSAHRIIAITTHVTNNHIMLSEGKGFYYSLAMIEPYNLEISINKDEIFSLTLAKN